MVKAKNSADRELSAISSILSAIEGLDGESLQRVFDYVFGRMSISTSRQLKPSPAPVVGHAPITVDDGARTPSIRDLKEEKKPESSNQMAALVAYYLSEIVPPDQQKTSINAADVEKYFKQAKFSLPKSVPSTLPNAAAAGYFDSIGNGLYKLNAVGYNLAAYGLPRDHSEASKKRTKTAKSKRKKSRK